MATYRSSALAKPLAAHEQAETLAKKKGGSAVERFLVKPDYAYPNTRMNRDELRAEMNKPSSYFHDLRLPNSNEIGLLKLEILQCIGLPRLDAVGETDAFCLAVCGSCAFKTDVMPPLANPMWLSKMRRACIFPLFHAYARLYVGVFDDDGEDQRDDFAGRVVLDIARMRPDCTYDVTLPLRQSAHVYMKRPRGSIRIRFHVSWYSERAAMLSYLPKGKPKFQPHEEVTVKCCDKKSFQNVALVVHGTHPQGRFSMKVVRALVREINFTRIHILRYLRKREFRNLRGWKNPIISGFLFFSWMHSVWANTVRYVPGNLITFLLLYLWKNYGNYAINESIQQGFLPPTWEEMFMALLFGEKSSDRQYIQPLEMTVTANEIPPVMIESAGSFRCSKGCSIDEVAKAFKEGVKVSTHRSRLRAYKNTFKGNEAVDFLVDNGYASSRDEAVSIGKQLQEKCLFEHVHRTKKEFKDAPLFYHFLIHDDSKYKFTTHEPKGKGLLRAIGFLDETRTFSDHQLEMPYSNGADHPRFTVKESLVIRSKDSKSLMERLIAEDEDDNDAEELDLDQSFGIDSSLDPLRLDKQDPSSRSVASEPSDRSLFIGEEEEVSNDTIVAVKVLKKPPLQDIDYKPKSDRQLVDVLAEVRNKVHGILLHCFNDRTYVVRENDATPSFRLQATDGKSSRWARSKSGDSLSAIPETENGVSVRDYRSATSLQKSGSSDRVRSSSPEKGSKRKSSGNRKEDNDRLLKTGSYSNSNRWVAKLGVLLQPIIEIAYEWIFLFRALFNIFTWQDPILSFWVSVIAPVVVIILHFFPWRIVFGTAGVVLFGPQNWVIRLMRERKGYVPLDMDTIIVRQKKVAESSEEESEEFLFSNRTNDNLPVDRATLDQRNVRRIAVPYSQLLYSNRFYDWPPEPDYARVLKEDPLAKSIAQTELDRQESHRSLKSDSSQSTKSNKKKWRTNITAVVRLKGSPMLRLGRKKSKDA